MSFPDDFIEAHRFFSVMRAIALIEAEASGLISLSADDKTFLATALEHVIL
jgi:hypothetical protein